MEKKLCISLIFSNFVVSKHKVIIFHAMHNLYANFVKILEICKNFSINLVNELGNIPRPGVVPRFSDLEVVALSLTAEHLSIDSENNLFDRLKEYKTEMPNLISRRQFNDRRKFTAELCETIRKRIASKMDGAEEYFCIDSKPIEVCRLSRGLRCKMKGTDVTNSPAFGYCATQKIYYYGFKLHAVCGLSGVIHSYDLSPANVHDIHYLKDVKFQFHDCCILGDRAYLSAELQQDLFSSVGIKLEVPYRLNMKNWRPTFKPYAKARKRIETNFSQLCDHFMLFRNYAKQTPGLFTRIIGKISAFTVLQYINYVNNRPIGRVKYALN